MVVIDPNVAFGMPVFVGSRISTAFLMSRKNGGASISRLARDYGRSETEIEEAISLEKRKRCLEASHSIWITTSTTMNWSRSWIVPESDINGIESSLADQQTTSTA